MEHEHRRPVRPVDWPAEVETPAQFMFDLTAHHPANTLVEVAPGVYGADTAEDCLFCKAEKTRGDGWVSGSC